jgi:parallel beta-helix repeat protein
MVNNLLGFEGTSLSHFIQAEINNNTINNKPVVYRLNITDRSFEEDAGQIILVNCDTIRIRNQDLFAIGVHYCQNLDIINNNIKNNFSSSTASVTIMETELSVIETNTLSKGINAIGSHTLTIDGNTINGTDTYIFLEEVQGSKIKDNLIIDGSLILLNSEFNKITENTIRNSVENGIELSSSNYNTISYNEIIDSIIFAIFIRSSEGNTITWNDFINSTKSIQFCSSGQVDCTHVYLDNTENGFSFNFWDDWTAPDKNFDCIVDDAYAIKGALIEGGPLVTMGYDITPVRYKIAKSGPMDNAICKPRVQVSMNLRKNWKQYITGLIILTIILIVNRVRKWRKKKLALTKTDLYPSNSE